MQWLTRLYPSKPGKPSSAQRDGALRRCSALHRCSAVSRHVSAGIEAVLDYAFPEPCAACKRPTQRPGALFCAACSACCDADPPGQRHLGVPALAPFAYVGPIRSAVHHFKFDEQAYLARRMARSMLHLPVTFTGYPALTLVPVPLHLTRLVERGYNQAALLAAAIAWRTELTVSPRALSRVAPSARQALLSRAARVELSQTAFHVRVRPQHPVVLVDDVLTTGSTARACINALRAANVKVAGILTFAQAGYAAEEYVDRRAEAD